MSDNDNLGSDHVCRRLMLFLDGTWNEDDEKRPATNIVYLRERLFWGLATRLRQGLPSDQKQFDSLPERFRKKAIAGVVFDGFEYIVYYDRGVGTGAFLDVIEGGVTGAGLDHKIREAYRFLSCWFRPGDEIFVFGFSRGAYTARSLCGYLNAVGLLRSELCTVENEERAWTYYRTAPGNRLSGEWYALRNLTDGTGRTAMHDDHAVRVRVLGVFDTVGALGIPAEGLRRFNRSKYEFHDTEVNSLVDIRLHAVAVDEPRWEFEPAMWTKPKFMMTNDKKSPTEQVWFSGAHSDIGGGYIKWNLNKQGLSMLPLAWMLQRLQHHVVNTPAIAEPFRKSTVETNYKAAVPFFMSDLLDPDGSIKSEIRELASMEQHKPWAALSIVRRDAHRLVNQLPLPGTKVVEERGRVPFADPICEMLHVSTFARLGTVVKNDKGRFMNFFGSTMKYRPYNLISSLPYVAATYIKYHGRGTAWHQVVRPIFSWKEIKVVDWDGKPLDPEKAPDVERVFKLLPSPQAIGLEKMPAAMSSMLRPDVKLLAGPVNSVEVGEQLESRQG